MKRIQRHDSVLDKVAKFVHEHANTDCDIHCNAGGSPWTIPPDILPTSDRPDLVVVNRAAKTISIFELTVPYESNINHSHEFKCHKYTPLIIDLQKTDYTIKYFAIEVGSRGFISSNNTNRLFAFIKSTSCSKIKAKDFKDFKTSLCKIAITSSFIIYKAKFQPTWCETPLINF